MSSSEARPTRAACATGEPDRERVQGDARGDRGHDLLRPLGEVGATEGQPALQRVAVDVVRPGRPTVSASSAASMATCAAATPVRRASASSTVSPGRRSASCGR